jgi:very-short-patch-repair endonuclease
MPASVASRSTSCWRAERLIVEVDGYAFHGGRAAFERDRRRDAELQAEGLRVMRVTWRQLVGEPDAVVARLTRALRGHRNVIGS